MLKKFLMVCLIFSLPTSTLARYCTYKIKKGESLYSIARASGISFKKLLQINKGRIKKSKQDQGQSDHINSMQSLRELRKFMHLQSGKRRQSNQNSH